MGYAIAAAVAIPVGLLDQAARLRSRPAFRGGIWMWWCGRVLLECGIAAGALFLAKQLNVKYSNDWYGWVAAGLLGASLAKSHVTQISRGERAVAYGLINIYEQVRGIFDKRIDDLSTTRQVAWINKTILPNLKTNELTGIAVADQLEEYVNDLAALSEVERNQELAWIETTRKEGLDDDAMHRALVRRAVRLRAWGLLTEMAKT